MNENKSLIYSFHRSSIYKKISLMILSFFSIRHHLVCGLSQVHERILQYVDNNIMTATSSNFQSSLYGTVE